MQTSSVLSGRRILSLWHHSWEGPRLRDYPQDIKDELDVVVLAVAQSEVPGTGRVAYSSGQGQPNEELAADVAAAKARGDIVLLGIGGAEDGGISVTSEAQAEEFVLSIDRLVETYDVMGVDINLEPSGSSWTQPALTDALKVLKSRHGQNFVVGLTVALYGEHTRRWLALAQALGPSGFDYFATMLYDFPEANDLRLIDVALEKVDLLIKGGVPIEKQILGFMVKPGPTYENASPPRVIERTWQAVEREHNGVLGAFLWVDKIDRDQGWTTSRLVAPLLRD